MERLSQWLPVLLRRWLLQAAAGLGCLWVGTVMFLTAEDRILLIISILLALSTALRCVSHCWLINKGEYEGIEGICISIKNAPLRKRRSIALFSKDGVEQMILSDKQARVRIGNQYRAYFQQPPIPQSCFAQDLFLALEDLREYQISED